MSLSFEEFIRKAGEKESKKLKFAPIEVPGIGEVIFQRPPLQEMIAFQKELFKQFGGQSTKEIDLSKLNIESLANISTEFIYNSCEFFRRKETRELFNKCSFEEIPLHLLGVEDCNSLAMEIYDKFNGGQEVKETIDEVKN